MRTLLVCGAILAGTVAAAPAAMTPVPEATPVSASPRATATAAPAFSAHAHVNFTAGANGAVTGDAQLVVLQRANLTRVELLSVHSDAMALPPIAGTILFDRASRTVTVWNDRSRRYYAQHIGPNTFGPSPRPAAAPTPPVAPQASALRDLDVLEFSMKLTEHTMTAGLPATGLAIELRVAPHGSHASAHVTATTLIADDYAFFPLTLDLSADVTPGDRTAHLTYAVDSWQPALPPLTMFRVPPGYVRASSLFAVLAGS